MKSSPRADAACSVLNTGQGALTPWRDLHEPSECAVCICKSPRYHPIPLLSGVLANPGNATSARSSQTLTVKLEVEVLRMFGTPRMTFHVPAGSGPGR